MSTLNQEAPPAEAPKPGQDFIRLEPFPKSDSYVATLVGFNFHDKYEFEKDDGSVSVDRAVELFYGALVDGKPYFAKTWPNRYSLHEKASYAKAYETLVGAAPKAGSKPNEMLGKQALISIKVEDKVGRKSGKPYRVSVIKSVGPVPSILAGTGTPLEALRPALEAALSNEKTENPY